MSLFPRWLKFLISVRNEESLSDFKLAYGLEYHVIALTTSIHTTRDLNDYITYRINKSTDIQKNILYFNTTNDLSAANESVSSMSPQVANNDQQHQLPATNRLDSGFKIKFTNYLSALSHASFLFVKMTLDLIEKGSLIIKSSNFKVLPQTINDLFRLYFNLKFSSRLAYDRLAAHVFAVCLCASRPLTLDEIYDAIGCATVANEKLTMHELLDQINGLDGFLLAFTYFDAEIDHCSQDNVKTR